MAVKAWGAGTEKKAKTLSRTTKSQSGTRQIPQSGNNARALKQVDATPHAAAPVAAGVEEIFFSNDAVSLCLLVNRRVKVMRVIDFRAGPTNAKPLPSGVERNPP